MPELPEVETVCRGLRKVLLHRRIVGVQTHRGNLRIPFPAHLRSIEKQKISAIERRAKYILMHLSGGETLILHLGMSGSLVIHAGKDLYQPQKHDHMIITLADGICVVLNDPRRFGLVALAQTKDLEKHKFFTHLGPEPFDKKFSAAYLAAKLKSRKVAIKLAIMDQTRVVGVGNIYASEALFSAGISPKRRAGSLRAPEVRKLVSAIQKVLKKAIAAGGSSLRDYKQATGELGYFQHQWAVYGKKGRKCKGCRCDIKKTGGVHQITQGARSTFYCPVKQE